MNALPGGRVVEIDIEGWPVLRPMLDEHDPVILVAVSKIGSRFESAVGAVARLDGNNSLI